VTTIAALALGELGARLLAKAPPFGREMVLPDHLTDRDAVLRWRFSPRDGRNSLGLRNREITPKPDTTRRILVLGDSLVWTGETTSGLLYTEVIENALNHTDDGGFEVVNAGVPGYTTYQELEFLKLYGLAMEPDHVVLCFVVNDVYHRYLHKPTADKLLDSEPSHHLHHFDASRFPGNLVAGSYLAHLSVFAIERAGRRLTGRPVYQFQTRGDFYLAWKKHGWSDTEDVIAEMHRVLVGRGIGLSIVSFPIRAQLEIDDPTADLEYVFYPQRRIEAISIGLGIPFLDLTPILREAGGVRLFTDSLHLRPRGNDVVAGAILGEIRRALADG
jgi:hypothetical protein